MVNIEVYFDEKENDRKVREENKRRIEENEDLLEIETNEPEPLKMEHFHLPLGMLIVGTIISFLFFIAEIITHRWGGH